MKSDTFQAVIACIGIGGFMIWRGFNQMKMHRLIEDMPTSKTRSAPQGLAEFQGYAWPTEKTIRCSQMNDCVSYAITLQEYRKRGKNSEWVTVFGVNLASDFFLLDSTGAVYVSMTDAQSETQKRVTNWGSLRPAAREHLLKTSLAGASCSGFPPGSGFLGSLFGGSFRIVEQYITLGSPVLAIGEFKTYSARPFPISPTQPLLKFFEKIKNDPNLKIGSESRYFDLDKNGRVDLDEIRRGMHHLARAIINASNTAVAIQETTNEAAIPFHGTVSKSENHPLYVIDAHEKTYAKNGKWAQYLTFLGGVALVLFGIYTFMAALHSY